MNDKIISIKIDNLGNPTIETSGYVGSACKNATKNIEDALAGKGMKVTEKPEMHHIAAEAEQHQTLEN